MSKSTAWILIKMSVKWTLIIFVALIVLLSLFDTLIPEFFGLLLFGWIAYLLQVLPRVTTNLEIALDAVVAVIFAAFGLHLIFRWWVRGRHGESAKWRFGWTVKITVMILLLFATSIAATGIIHQVGWLAKEEMVFDRARSRSVQTKELSNLKQLSMCLRLYSLEHDNKFPQNLDELIPEFLPTSKLLFSRGQNGEPPQRVIYYRGFKDNDSPDLIVLASPEIWGSGEKVSRVVVHIDGSAEVIKEKEFQKLIHEQEAKRAKNGTVP